MEIPEKILHLYRLLAKSEEWGVETQAKTARHRRRTYARLALNTNKIIATFPLLR
jgi:hypothetical protein